MLSGLLLRPARAETFSVMTEVNVVPWTVLKIVEPALGKNNSRVECVYCEHQFWVTSVTRTVGRLVCDTSSGVKACTKVQESHPEVHKAFEAESDRKTEDKPKKKRTAEKAKRDQAVARFFYANGIAFNLSSSKYFTEMLQKVGQYGSAYQTPKKNTLRTSLLEKEKLDLQQFAPLGQE